jgi:hypothetical protein
MHLTLAFISALLATAKAIQVTQPAAGDTVDVSHDWEVTWTSVSYVQFASLSIISQTRTILLSLDNDSNNSPPSPERTQRKSACIFPTLWTTRHRPSSFRALSIRH